VLDPGCGDGAILSVVSRHVDRVTGVELDEGRANIARDLLLPGTAIVCADYLNWGERPALTHGDTKPFDLVIGNPPFSLALEFVQVSLKLAPVVAFLLRLPWLASQGRADFLRQKTPSVYVMPKRPEFVMSIKCVKISKRKRSEKLQESFRFQGECSYQEYRSMAAERPKTCPLCGSKVTITTTDATDYAWMVWRRGTPIVEILPVPPEES
jgi:predicted RNA methylase